MPRKKKVPVLPPIHNGSPPWSARSGGSARYEGDVKDSERRVFWEMDGMADKAGIDEPPSQSEPSTAAPLGMSRDDARSISQLLDDSLQVGFGANADVNTGDSWEIQSPDDIIRDVTQYVESRKPWRTKLDDSVLEKRHNERQDRLERGFHIILPDNRVRLMEDELSYRTRATLLDMDPEDAPPPTPPRRPSKSKAKSQKMKQNPWYLKPGSWYALKDPAKEERLNDFPYANVILNLPDEPKTEEPPDRGQPNFQQDNFTVNAYKHYMKGNRLPHFLA